MGREVRTKIEQLREKMAERGMDAYLIPTSDFHGSEYVSGYFKCRKYMTGFTGSAGTAVITMEDAGLWTDGRYFVLRSGGRADDAGIFEKTYAGTGCSGF